MARSEPHEIIPGIYLIQEQGRIGALKPPVNLYVLAGRNGLVFDSGYGNSWFVNQVVNGIRTIERDSGRPGTRVARILPSHTHPDHFSGLFHLQKRLGLQILSTPDMAENLRRRRYREIGSGGVRSMAGRSAFGMAQHLLYGIKRIKAVDEILSPGQTLAIDDDVWQILAAPGHCDDHIALYCRRRGVLLAGDLIMRSVTTWLGPPRSNLKHYLESLEKLLALPELHLILSAHGGPVENPRERIRQAIAHRRERTDQVLNLVAQSGSTGVTVRSAAIRLYAGPEKNKRFLARGWIDMTLRMLETEGSIKSRGRSGRKIYYRV